MEREGLLAFEALKTTMMSPSVLSMPDFEPEFVIECDAFGYGIGVVLMQNHNPIAYYSQALKGKAVQLSAYEREMLAILFAVKKWRQYLLERRFIVKIDQKSITYILDQRPQHPWLQKLLDTEKESLKGLIVVVSSWLTAAKESVQHSIVNN